MSNEELAGDVVDGISRLINLALVSLASEQRYPGGDVDASGDKMRDARDAVKRLRALREEFENIVTGVV